MKTITLSATIALLAALSGCNNAGNSSTPAADSALAASVVDSVPTNPEKNCYFGDLHLHTSLSCDAFLFGAKSFPENAYQYAMGEEEDYMGEKIKRNAPLDFLAVTDHSEYLGLIQALTDPNGLYANTAYYKQFTDTNQKAIVG